MKKMMSYSPEELKTMGDNGYKLIDEKYSWRYTSRNIINKYKELLISV
jgi:glycosyltransferase involved in cell wall biosynthesis